MSPEVDLPTVLDLVNCHKYIGGDQASPTLITSVNVRIPASRITGDVPLVFARTESANAWEQVTGDFTTAAGADHTFSAQGTKVDLRIVASPGTVISARDGDGLIVQAIFVKVTGTA